MTRPFKTTCVVESKQAKVKLTGKVKTPAARQKVEKIAKEEPEVAVTTQLMEVTVGIRY
jgi:osmotically-inducible protein OsmY